MRLTLVVPTDSRSKEPEVTMTPLRRAAEAAENASGLRAEIIRGVVMMSPPPPGKHAGIINALSKQLISALPGHLDRFQVAAAPMPDDPDDYAAPDLMVCDAGFGESDDWLTDPGDVFLVVEVVSKGNSTKDTRGMVSWYADAGIPTYLLVDPRDGTWTLHTEPREGEYQGRPRRSFGEEVPPADLGLRLTTAGFARYA
jgi:Uma2 family endonuclease